MKTIPLIRHKRVFHVGLLDLNAKGIDSHEGHGLSVSLHPGAWQQITPLSGTVNTLKKSDPRFLDFHKTLSNKKLMQEIVEWAKVGGYAEDSIMHRVEWHDTESDEIRFILCTTESEADIEAEELGASVVTLNSYCHTLKACERLRWRNREGVMRTDAVVILWAEAQRLDGVWWNDRLDVINLSAPRGVIFPEKLKDWKLAPN
jgi:hypothetical protein